MAQKNSRLSIDQRRSLIDRSHPELSISALCRLLSLPRSSFYHVRVGDSEEDLLLKRYLDRLYTECPFFGSRRMVLELAKLGFEVCRKKVVRLMREMGIHAIYSKPRLSGNGGYHEKFPYLLHGFKVREADQVWAADISVP